MKLAIPDFISNSYFPVIAAEHLGCFEAEGLDLHVELLFPVTKAMAALRDGEYDFAVGTASAILAAFPNWDGARILAAIAQRTYWFLVLRSDLGVEPGDVAAVKGLRIGAAPGVDVALKRLLSEEGIDPDRDVSIGPVPGTAADSVSFGVTAAKALAAGDLDGFWANGMGAEVAVRQGIGTVVLDVRRGLAPAPSLTYTFAALVARAQTVESEPNVAAAAVRGLVAAQARLRANPELAGEVGAKVLPVMEAGLIGELIRRDVPYYDATVSELVFADLQRFAADVGLLTVPKPYDQVVATQFSRLWKP